MKMYKASDIVWDTDNEEIVGLPSTAFIHAESLEEVADELSNMFGFCVSSLSAAEYLPHRRLR